MHDRRGAVVRSYSLSVTLFASFAILVPPFLRKATTRNR